MLSPLDHVIVWDLERYPTSPASPASMDLTSRTRLRRARLSGRVPEAIFHKIVCVGALIAERVEGVWIIRCLGAPSIAERSEVELIQSFVDRIGEFRPQLLTLIRAGSTCRS